MERHGAWYMPWTRAIALVFALAAVAPSRAVPIVIEDAHQVRVIDAVERSEPGGRTVAARLPQVVSRTPADGA